MCLCRRICKNCVFLSITSEVITAKANDLACVSVFALTLCFFFISIPLIFLMEEDCTFWLQYLFSPHKSHEEQPYLGPKAKCCIRKLYWAHNCWTNVFAVLNKIGLTSLAEFGKFKNMCDKWRSLKYYWRLRIWQSYHIVATSQLSFNNVYTMTVRWIKCEWVNQYPIKLWTIRI